MVYGLSMALPAHNIKVTIEYDGLKEEQEIPFCNLYKAIQDPTVCHGLTAKDEMPSIMLEHLVYVLCPEMLRWANNDESSWSESFQKLYKARVLYGMCWRLVQKMTEKLKTL